MGADAPANLNPDLRVILVGRTGLDAKLRLDPNVELVRVRTALEAVGEVVGPLESAPSVRTVVIIAPDAEPAASDNAEHRSEYPVEFLRAVRSLNPEVKVLRLSTPGTGNAEIADIYDGSVKADLSCEALRAMLRVNTPALRHNGAGNGMGHGMGHGTGHGTGNTTANGSGHEYGNGAHGPAPLANGSHTPNRNGSHAPAAPQVPVPQILVPEPTVAADLGAMLSSLGERAAIADHIGDETLVRLLLRGRDVVPAALAMIRRRLDDAQVTFTPAGGAIEAPPADRAPADRPGADVAWDAHVYGRLEAVGISESELSSHANWLATWLRLRDQQSQLREAAFTDPCTGAYNRRYCDKFLAAAMSEARASRRPLTVLYLDLDNFKQYNDRYGHAAGDDILNEVVRLLKAGVRPSDRVCRVGGDEFVVIFHEPGGPRQPDSKPPSSVFHIAKRFQQQILSHRFPKLGIDAPGNLTISGGLVTFPWDGNSPQELIDKADLLALESKRMGKNVITIGPGATTQQAAEQRYDEQP